MSYTAEEEGLLTIYLGAINALHAQNITRQMLAQNVLMDAVLYALPQDTFVNKLVTMNVLVTPKSNFMDCLWIFGDVSAPRHTNNNTVGHEYTHPGHYRVQVGFSSTYINMTVVYLKTVEILFVFFFPSHC